jgi:hypothetical protein
MIHKQPKGCDWKKSQKGCCIVTRDENGNYSYTDGHTFAETIEYPGEMVTVFENGKMVGEWNLAGVRTRMYGIEERL